MLDSPEGLTGQAGVEIWDLPFPAGLLPLLVSDLPLGPLVTEDFDLAEGTVDGLVAAVVVAVGVNLDVQRKTLHALLGGEVGAQTVDGDEDLKRKEARMLWLRHTEKLLYLYTVALSPSTHLRYLRFSLIPATTFYPTTLIT